MQTLYELASFKSFPKPKLLDRICIVLETPEDVLFPKSLMAFRLLKQPEPAILSLTQLQKAKFLALEASSIEEEVEHKVDNAFLHEEILRLLDSLKSREAEVLRFRFGLEDGRSRTLEEVGRKLGITRARVYQIEAEAFRKLRHPTHSRKLVDFLG